MTCLHLNHKTEKKRLAEIDTIKKHLEPVFQENQAQIWSGDFNALTKGIIQILHNHQEWVSALWVAKFLRYIMKIGIDRK